MDQGKAAVVKVGAPADGAFDRLQGLDGLRGLALMMVIIAHLSIFSIGWVGMQSFFVLSGFLITRILLNDRKQADTLGAYFRRFYVRRALRVFPIYYAYLIALTALVFIIPALHRVQGELPAAYLYYYNWQMMMSHEHTRMLGHLWSMSVEEQFYLVWPWFIAFVPRAYIPYVCVVLIGLGPLVREAAISVLFPSLGLSGHRLPIYTYIFTGSHVDAFAFGGLINFVQWRPRAVHLAITAALALVVGLAINGAYGMDSLSFGWPLFMPYGYQYSWGYSVVNFFCFLVICAILAGGSVRRFFSIRLLDYLGKRSYSSYVIHFPLLAFMDPLQTKLVYAWGQFPGTLLFAIPYLAAVFVASGLMYRYIEMPFNGFKDRFQGARKIRSDDVSQVPT
jgi:peptidoglycan/LPS O-acetylase OafA/YrhL